MLITEFQEEMICRILAGEADEEEEIAFRKLLAENEGLRKEYSRIERTWYCGKYAGKWEQVDEKNAWIHIKTTRIRRIRWKRIFYWNVAAISLLFLGAGLLSLFRGDENPTSTVNKVAQSICPGQSKALLVLASGEKVELGTTAQKTILEKGVTIEGDSAVLIYQPQALATEPLFNELIIPVGGEYRLELSDGSLVYLNSESKLKYPVAFGQGPREVELEGEAYFEVAPDKEHPFFVKTKDLNIQVLGTGFNVSVYREVKYTEVTLAHGSVAVRNLEKELILKPDEQLVLDKTTGQISIQQVEAQKICAWKNGVLYFEGMPLEELAGKLSRWYDVTFFFTHEKLKQLKFSGAFKKYNNIDYVLSLIEATTDIRFQIKDRTIVACYK